MKYLKLNDVTSVLSGELVEQITDVENSSILEDLEAYAIGYAKGRLSGYYDTEVIFDVLNPLYDAYLAGILANIVIDRLLRIWDTNLDNMKESIYFTRANKDLELLSKGGLYIAKFPLRDIDTEGSSGIMYGSINSNF